MYVLKRQRRRHVGNEAIKLVQRGESRCRVCHQSQEERELFFMAWKGPSFTQVVLYDKDSLKIRLYSSISSRAF